MIDIHTHILPRIDDGPLSWDESIQILRAGQEEGIREVVVTPHVLGNLDQELEREIQDKFGELKRRASSEGIGLRFHLGSEIYIQPEINLNSPISTFDGKGRYLLIEFPLGRIPEYADDLIFKLVLDGYTPILAHPERNLVILRNPGKLYSLIQMGVLIQVNSGSLSGEFGSSVRELALEMMDNNWVHFVASDCHDPEQRPMRLKEAWGIVEKNWGKDRARLLFLRNPRKAIRGEKIIPPEPLPFERKRRKIIELLKRLRPGG